MPKPHETLYVQAQPKIHLPDAKAKALMERIQNAGTEVVEAKVCLLSYAIFLDHIMPSSLNYSIVSCQASVIKTCSLLTMSSCCAQREACHAYS